MRAETGSFRAQETGVHIPLLTPWPPFFPRRSLTGCGIGTRDSEHETTPPQRQIRLAKGRARALSTDDEKPSSTPSLSPRERISR